MNPTTLTVDTAARVIEGRFGIAPCRIGRNGACPLDEKREGDGRTPIGRFAVRGALFRRGRWAPPRGLALPWRWIGATDGWSDDPADPAYNRPVRHPHAFGAERMWRGDAAYDSVLILGHNDAPVHAGAGSAIFVHLIADAPATEGCIGVDERTMTEILREAGQPLAVNIM